MCNMREITCAPVTYVCYSELHMCVAAPATYVCCICVLQRATCAGMPVRLSHVCVAACCSLLQRVAVYCSAMQHTRNRLCECHICVLQCGALCCSVLQCVAVRRNMREIACASVTYVCCSMLQCVAMLCNALQCVAVHCSAVQCVAVQRSVLQ